MTLYLVKLYTKYTTNWVQNKQRTGYNMIKDKYIVARNSILSNTITTSSNLLSLYIADMYESVTIDSVYAEVYYKYNDIITDMGETTVTRMSNFIFALNFVNTAPRGSEVFAKLGVTDNNGTVTLVTSQPYRVV